MRPSLEMIQLGPAHACYGLGRPRKAMGCGIAPGNCQTADDSRASSTLLGGTDAGSDRRRDQDQTIRELLLCITLKPASCDTACTESVQLLLQSQHSGQG